MAGALESDTFKITLDMDDIIDFSSFEKGKKILKNIKLRFNKLKKTLNSVELLDYQPNRYPFLMIDYVTKVIPWKIG